jgi:hypothetical protein
MQPYSQPAHKERAIPPRHECTGRNGPFSVGLIGKGFSQRRDSVLSASLFSTHVINESL